MDHYGIIEAFEIYADSKKWLTVLGFDEFNRSIGTVQEMQPGEIMFIYDFRASPKKVNGRTVEITYTCLMMLGRKIDDNNEISNLDETHQQKYDRRLKDLMILLDIAIGEIACDNGLEVVAGDIIVDPNRYVENIDFAAATNVIFTQ